MCYKASEKSWSSCILILVFDLLTQGPERCHWKPAGTKGSASKRKASEGLTGLWREGLRGHVTPTPRCCGKSKVLGLKANCLRMCKWSVLKKEEFFLYSMNSDLCNWLNQRYCRLMMNKMVDRSGVEAATLGADRGWCSPCPLGHWPTHKSGWILMCPTLCNLPSKFPFGEL